MPVSQVGIKGWRCEVNCKVFKDVKAGTGGGGRIVRITLILFWGRAEALALARKIKLGVMGVWEGNSENPIRSR